MFVSFISGSDFNSSVKAITLDPSAAIEDIAVTIAINEDLVNEAEEGFLVGLSVRALPQEGTNDIEVIRSNCLVSIIDNDRKSTYHTTAILNTLT